MAIAKELLIFWSLLKSGCSMDYHGNHDFTVVKIRDFATGRPAVSYIIELNHMLHKNLLFQANTAHFVLLYISGWGTLTPPYNI